MYSSSAVRRGMEVFPWTKRMGPSLTRGARQLACRRRETAHRGTGARVSVTGTESTSLRGSSAPLATASTATSAPMLSPTRSKGVSAKNSRVKLAKSARHSRGSRKCPRRRGSGSLPCPRRLIAQTVKPPAERWRASGPKSAAAPLRPWRQRTCSLPAGSAASQTSPGNGTPSCPRHPNCRAPRVTSS